MLQGGSVVGRRNTVNFDVTGFRREQRQLPRGVAIWVFYFKDAPEDPWIARKLDRQIRAMTYLAAKDYARAEAVRRRVTAVRVDPYPL